MKELIEKYKELVDPFCKLMEAVIKLHPNFYMDDPLQESCYMAYHNCRKALSSLESEIAEAEGKEAVNERSMIQFILDIDQMTTNEFCRKYSVPFPTVLGGSESFLQIDAVKHRMFVEQAKKLNIFHPKEAVREEEFHVCVIPDNKQIFVTDRDHLPVGATEHIVFDNWDGALNLGKFLARFCHYYLELDNEAGRFAESEARI